MAGGGTPAHGGTAMTTCFRKFLVETFGLERLGEGEGVLDVAGGKGQLSFELVNLCRGVRSTVVDARNTDTINYRKIVDRHKRLAVKRRAHLRRKEPDFDEQNAVPISVDSIPYEVPGHVVAYFGPDLWRRDRDRDPDREKAQERARESWERGYGGKGRREREATTSTTTTTTEGEKPKEKKKKKVKPGSRYRGVAHDIVSGTWAAYIRQQGGTRCLGRFGSEVEAAKAFDAASLEAFGPEAKGLNCRDEGVGEGPSPAAGEHAGGRHHAVVMGCWVCGPVGRGGEPQRAIQPAAKCDDGVSGYSQHKSFRCPHNAARSGEQIRPRRLDPEEAARVIAGCSVVVGLHPDQATGDIVDFALETNKPFALVPCCTFAQTFQDRVLADGKRVSTYEDLLTWLRQKDEGRIKQTTLGAPGRNVVLYRTEG